MVKKRAKSIHGYVGDVGMIQEREEDQVDRDFKIDSRGHNGEDSLEVRESGLTN